MDEGLLQVSGSGCMGIEIELYKMELLATEQL